MSVFQKIIFSLWLICIAVCGIAIAQTTPFTQQQQARQLFIVASAQYLEDKDIVKAREGYLQSIKLYPSYSQPRYNLAVFAEAEENWSEAIKWFTEFLRFDDKSSFADKARTEIIRLKKIQFLDSTPEGKKKRQYDDAIMKARGLVNAGLAKEAIAKAGEAVKIDGTRWEAYAVTSSVLVQQHQFIDAAVFLQEAINLAPPDKKSILQRTLSSYSKEKQYYSLGQAGSVAFKAAKYQEAAEKFVSAWQLFPNRDEYGLDAAVAYAIAGDKTKAEAILTILEAGAKPATMRKIKELRIKTAKLH